jgi:hypothetical protein
MYPSESCVEKEFHATGSSRTRRKMVFGTGIRGTYCCEEVSSLAELFAEGETQ